MSKAELILIRNDRPEDVEAITWRGQAKRRMQEAYARETARARKAAAEEHKRMTVKELISRTCWAVIGAMSALIAVSIKRMDFWGLFYTQLFGC